MVQEFNYARKRKLAEIERIESEYQKQKRALTLHCNSNNISLVERYKDTEMFKHFSYFQDISYQEHSKASALFIQNLQKAADKLKLKAKATTFEPSVDYLESNPKQVVGVVEVSTSNKLKETQHQNKIARLEKVISSYKEREEEFRQHFKKSVKTLFNAACSQITLCSETVQSLKKCYLGSTKRNGPKLFLSTIQEKRPNLFSIACQGVSNHLVKVFCTSLTSAKVKQGNVRFGLVYMATALCMEFSGFADILLATLLSSSPYSYPGYMETLLKKQQLELSDINRLPDDTNSVYILRQQGIICFLAALTQLDLNTFRSLNFIDNQLVLEEKLCVFPFESNPRICYGWKFLSGHLNSTLSRFLPYMLSAFIAIAGFELKKQLGNKVLFKLFKTIKVYYLPKAKELAVLTKENENDLDRFTGFQTFINKILETEKLNLYKPGITKDLRNLLHSI